MGIFIIYFGTFALVGLIPISKFILDAVTELGIKTVKIVIRRKQTVQAIAATVLSTLILFCISIESDTNMRRNQSTRLHQQSRLG